MNKIVKMLYLIIQIGFTILVTIFLCIGLGYAVKHFFGIDLMVWFIVIGVIAGFRSAYILIRKMVSFDNPEDEYLKMMSQGNDSFAEGETKKNIESEKTTEDADPDDWDDEFDREGGERP